MQMILVFEETALRVIRSMKMNESVTVCRLDCNRVLPFHQVIKAAGRAPHDLQVNSYLRSADSGSFSPSS